MADGDLGGLKDKKSLSSAFFEDVLPSYRLSVQDPGAGTTLGARSAGFNGFMLDPLTKQIAPIQEGGWVHIPKSSNKTDQGKSAGPATAPVSSPKRPFPSGDYNVSREGFGSWSSKGEESGSREKITATAFVSLGSSSSSPSSSSSSATASRSNSKSATAANATTSAHPDSPSSSSFFFSSASPKLSSNSSRSSVSGPLSSTLSPEAAAGAASSASSASPSQLLSKAIANSSNVSALVRTFGLSPVCSPSLERRNLLDLIGSNTAVLEELKEMIRTNSIHQAKYLEYSPTEESLLGEGRHAEVFLGSYLGRKVAIKRMRSDDDALSAALAEVHVLRQLSNPHIVQLVDFFCEDDLTLAAKRQAVAAAGTEATSAGSGSRSGAAPSTASSLAVSGMCNNNDIELPVNSSLATIARGDDDSITHRQHGGDASSPSGSASSGSRRTSMGLPRSPRYLVLLEFCPNGHLWDMIQNSPFTLNFEKWRSLALQLVDAVCYLHSLGLVHHDIKPHNILMDERWQLKLADFASASYLPRLEESASSPSSAAAAAGTGKNNGPSEDSSHLHKNGKSTLNSLEDSESQFASGESSNNSSSSCSSGTLSTETSTAVAEENAANNKVTFGVLYDGLGRGTTPYSAPELFPSPRSKDAGYGLPSDIYSTGIVLWCMLAGQEPFYCVRSAAQMLMFIRRGFFASGMNQIPTHFLSSKHILDHPAANGSTTATSVVHASPSTETILLSSLSSSSFSKAMSSSAQPSSSPRGSESHPQSPSAPFSSSSIRSDLEEQAKKATSMNCAAQATFHTTYEYGIPDLLQQCVSTNPLDRPDARTLYQKISALYLCEKAV